MSGFSSMFSQLLKLFRKLLAIENVWRHQTGDDEIRAVFPLEALAQVAGVIRAKRWGGTGRGRPGNFHSEPGQVTTSRPEEATFEWSGRFGRGAGLKLAIETRK